MSLVSKGQVSRLSMGAWSMRSSLLHPRITLSKHGPLCGVGTTLQYYRAFLQHSTQLELGHCWVVIKKLQRRLEVALSHLV